ncbi:MAG: DUF695 domain-containing protein [Gammaproteobacteria bacterium]|nr:DUF695 domain-containing protein [Gammaproteobacteria bacterium]
MELKSLPWALAKGVLDGNSSTMRFRKFSEDFPRSDYPVRINIVCDIQEKNERGLPTRQEAERLGRLEDELLNEIEDDESVLAMVITSCGKREFIFQTHDPEQFRERISHVYEQGPEYHLNYMTAEDDEWEYISEFMPKDS